MAELSRTVGAPAEFGTEVLRVAEVELLSAADPLPFSVEDETQEASEEDLRADLQRAFERCAMPLEKTLQHQVVFEQPAAALPAHRPSHP